jgi:hypothetical protein
MPTPDEMRLNLHHIRKGRDVLCDKLQQRRHEMTPDEIRLAVQLAEYDQMITCGAKMLTGLAV